MQHAVEQLKHMIRPDSEQLDRDTDPAGVLLQVVLPIVLILAFFALTSARNYETKRAELGKIQQELTRERFDQMRTELMRKQRMVVDQRSAIEEKMRELAEELARLDSDLEDLARTNSALSKAEVEQLRQQLVSEREKLLEDRKAYERQRELLSQEITNLDAKKRRLEVWWNEVSQTEKAILLKEISEAHIELQRQRIVAALEKVKAAEREDLGVIFLKGKSMRLDDNGHLSEDHERFSEVCQRIAKVYASNESIRAERNRLYRVVLAAAELGDDHGSRLALTQMEAEQSLFDLTDKHSRNVITNENRDFLAGEVEAFIAKVREEALVLQVKAIDGAFSYHRQRDLESLYNWNPRLREIRSQLVVAIRDDTDTRPLEDALTAEMYRKIESDFKIAGYSFLRDAWTR